MNLRTALITTSAITALATAGVAGAAEAPLVSHQAELHGKAPVTVAGTGVKKGDWMGSKQFIIYKKVRVDGHGKVTLTLKAPKGKTVAGLAVDEKSGVGFVAQRDYPGHKTVTVTAYGRNAEGPSRGRILALVR
ncbi:MAG: hypothetical protein HZB46_18875 [Solirubrobacterales bacterium]|nr:hypothetical protein [Solirubrobacterales bacterium]